jgi:hypothetical protein
MSELTLELLKAAIRAWRVMDAHVPDAVETNEIFEAINRFPESMREKALQAIKENEGGEEVNSKERH